MCVDELMGEDLGSLSGAELSARVVALEEARDRLEAARLALVGEWDARGEWAADGASSAKAWIAAHGRSSLAQAGGLVATARKLRAHMPITAAWVADGRLAPAKARLLAGAVNARTAEVFAGHEQLLVELAAAHTVDETAAMMRHWSLRADQEGRHPGDGDDRLAVAFTLAGRWELSGSLGAEGGAIVAHALDQVIGEWRHAARERGERLGSPALMRAFALVELARRAAGQKPNARPLLWVLVEEHNLRAGTGTAEIAGAGPVGVSMAQRLACDCDISYVTRDERGRIIDLGRTQRSASAVQRRLLEFAFDHCAWPGCQRPSRWCEAHHIEWWEHGGHTDIANLIPLCSYHHHRCHEGGFRVTRTHDDDHDDGGGGGGRDGGGGECGGGCGELIFSRPDGTTLTAPPIAA